MAVLGYSSLSYSLFLVTSFVLKSLYSLVLYLTASTLSRLNLWVEAFELYTSILGGKLPVHTLVTRIAPLLPCAGFIAQCLNVWNPSIQALAGEGTQFNFGNIEPAAVFGGMVHLKPFEKLPSLLGRKGLIERADPMRIEVITHQAYPRGFWVAALKQVSDLMGPVHGGPVRG